MPPSTKDSKKDAKSSSSKSGSKNDDPSTHRRQKSNSTQSGPSDRKSSVLRTNAQSTGSRNPATTRDNRTGLPSQQELNAIASRPAPSASRAVPAAPAEPEGPIVKTRVTPISQSKHANSGASPQPPSTTPQGAAMGGGNATGPSAYGSMGPQAYSMGANSMQDYGSAAPGSMGAGGYGSMGPGGYGSMGAGDYGSMGGAGGYGSMGGAGGYGSMGGMGSQMDMQRQGSFQGNPYGSMGAGGMGSQMGGMGSQMGDGSTMMNPYGSMGAGGMGGSMYGMGPGSMYGMDPNGMYGANSMYGMNPTMGGMGGSMYGADPMMMNSMYGMGGPMMGGSMYGMNPMMGSMYGMGGPMGSMYGMGSQYMLGRYNSMGLGSNYGSFYNVFRTNSARAEFEPSGGYSGAMGLFTAPENFKTTRKIDPMPQTSKTLESSEDAKTGSRSAAGTKIDAADASKSRSAGAKDGAARDSNSKPAGDDSKSTAEKPQSNARAVADDRTTKADASEKAASPSANKSRGGIELGKPKAAKTEPGVHRITKSIDNNVHTLAVVDDKSLIDKDDPKKVKTPDGKTFTMDEVTPLSDFDVDGSDLLVDVTEQSNCGHNVAILALCSKSSTSAAEAVVKAVVARAVELNKANEKAGEKITVWANAAAFPKAGQCRDLLAKPTELVPKDATYGSSPIFGPRVRNIEDQVIVSPADAEEVISKAVNVTTDEEMVYVLFTFKQMRASAASDAGKKGSDHPEVYVSTLLVTFFREANLSYLPTIRHRSHTTFPGVLFAQAVGGACRTVVVVPVAKADDAATRGAALQQGETMREIKNGALRSGNASRFLEFTQQALEKSEAGKAKPSVIAQQQQMMKDAKELIGGGPEVKPKTYEINVTSQPTPSTSATASAAAATRNATNDKTVRVALVVENADASSVSDKDKATVMVAQQKEAEVDELVYHKKGTAYPRSDLMARTSAALTEGLITAVLSVEAAPSVELKERFTWVSFKKSVSDALAANNGRGGDSCEVHLHMCVVHQRQVLADLLDASSSGSAPIPLVVVSSPIVGPMVYNTKSVVVKDKASVASTVDDALTRAGSLASSEDAMVLAVAVCKTTRKKDADVCLAALFTASAETPAPFVGLVSEDQRYSRSLFSYALSGPCTTTMVLVVDKSKLSDPSTVTALDGVKKVASKSNLPNRDGSVRRFTAQATQSLERTKAKIDGAKSAEERQHYERNAKKLPLMLEDHNALLESPADASIPIYMPDGSRPPATTARSVSRSAATSTGPTGMTDAQSVLIVLEKPGAGAGAVQVDAASHTITGQNVSCTPTELIEMQGSTLRSSHVDSIVTLALTGYNTAMLTADTSGSTVGRSLVTRSVRMLLTKLTGKSEAYWSVVVVRNGKLKDILTAGSSYADLAIASSPIFGPCVDGASFAKLDSAGTGVEEAIKSAATERAYAGGMVLVTVVPKIVQEDGKDVMMPSMVLTIANDDTKIYNDPLSVDQKRRGIFHYVFGGPCYTLFVAGIKPSEADSATAILRTCNEVMKIKNPPLRNGSVMRFIEHSVPKLKALQGKLASAQGTEKNVLTTQVNLLENMIGDAKNLVANPVNCVPPTYSSPKPRS